MTWPGPAVLGVGGDIGLDKLGASEQVWLVGAILYVACLYLPQISVSKPKGRSQLCRWGSPC